MNLFRQTKVELATLLKLKSIKILTVLVIIAGFVSPIIGMVMKSVVGDNYVDMYYYGSHGGEDITVDGMTITTDNPLYYKVSYLYSDIEEQIKYGGLEAGSGELELMYQYRDLNLSLLVELANEITEQEDPRVNLTSYMESNLCKKFVLEAEDFDKALNAVNFITYIDGLEQYKTMSPEEKATKGVELGIKLEEMKASLMENDFDSIMDYNIDRINDEINNMEAQIAANEKLIVENPDLESSLGKEITNLQNHIKSCKEVSIPAFEYRKEHGISPTDYSDWRNMALYEQENATYSYERYSNPYTEEEFLKDTYEVQTYKTYPKYLDAYARNAIKAQEKLAIAKASIDANKPDMQFVREGARYQVNSSLSYALFVAYFAILVGAMMIAREFQDGTVRLLMIRPRTRAKVYLSKFFAGFTLVYSTYFMGMIMNIIVNGIISGFGDYAYPIYSATGSTSFWVVIIGRMLICSTSILLAYALAFCFGAIIRNAAMAMLLPSAAIIGGYIGFAFLGHTKYGHLLAYTPLPYISFADFFKDYSTITYLAEQGTYYNITVGVVMYIAMAVIAIALGLVNFKRHDITN